MEICHIEVCDPKIINDHIKRTFEQTYHNYRDVALLKTKKIKIVHIKVYGIEIINDHIKMDVRTNIT